MRVLVTGCNGYIGPIMVKVLRAEGHDVAGTDRNYYENSDVVGDVPPLPLNKTDIRDIPVTALEGFDAIVHLTMGELRNDWTWDINVEATVRQGAKDLYESYKAVGMTLDRFQSRSHVRIKQLKHLIDNNEGSLPTLEMMAKVSLSSTNAHYVTQEMM
jgi:NAD(P)-dependent dehydrogenase (short-subunit alcohol dehydrogenase family)